MKPTRHGRGNRWSRGSSRRELHSRGSSLLSPRIPVGCAGVATAIPAGSFFSPNLRACSQWLLSSLPPLPQIFFYLDDSDGALLLWWREVTNIKPSPSRFLSSHGLNLCVLPTWYCLYVPLLEEISFSEFVTSRFSDDSSQIGLLCT